MNEIVWSPEAAQYRDGVDRLAELAFRYRDDEGLRRRIEAGDTGDVVAELGLELAPNAAARFVVNTDDVVHFVMPPDPNAPLDEAELGPVTAGSGTNTASSAGSLGTLSCFPSCLGSTSSVGTAGTACGN